MANIQTATGARWPEFDPLRWLWHGLTSVRFALIIITFLALSSLLGVLIPQLPIEMRGNTAAVSAWMQYQHQRFGVFTSPMDRLGLFDIFRSLWFVCGLGTLVASVCVCTANRLPPIWRNVTRPLTRVPDEYYERGAPSISVALPDTQALVERLQRRRYRVTLTHEGESTYLFADRFPWAQFATFISHLALILFLAGGFVTVLTAKEQEVFVAEGDSAGAAVFSPDDRDHMQIYVQDAQGVFDKNNFPLDFRTYLTVYRNGKQVAQGVTTVNRPLHYGGFAFHQSLFFPDGAGLTVRDVASGRVVYDEVLALSSTATTPRILVRDAAGNTVLDDVIVPTDFIADVAGTLVTIPSQDRHFWIGARPGNTGQGWQLIVFETGESSGNQAILSEGQKQDLNGLSMTFAGMTGVPSVIATGLPGANGEAVAELSQGPQGPLLTLGPVGGQALALSPGQAVELNGLQYTFTGQREFSGLTVRRDPGSFFIWLATGLFLVGLAFTFYTPRRRLWGKIAGGQGAFRGLGGRGSAIEKELRQAAARASEPASTRRTA